MSEKTKETIHKEVVEKPTEKASIIYEYKRQKSFSEGETEYIQVKDATSKKAFDTFKKIKEFVDNNG